MRDQLRHRPLVLLVAAYAVGLLLPREPLASALLLAFLPLIRTLALSLGLAAAVALGALLSPPPPPPSLEDKTRVQGLATVASVPEEVRTGRRVLLDTTVGKVIAVFPPPLVPVMGERWSIAGEARPPVEGQDGWLRQNRAVGTMKVDPSSAVRVSKAGDLVQLASDVRLRFLSFTARWLPPGLASLLAGICINSDRTIPESLRDSLRATGTIHIVSASGFHVFILAGAVGWVARRLGANRVIQVFVVAGTLGFFTLVAGLEPPIVRSSVMAILLQLAFFARREPDALSALAFALGGYLVIFPSAIDDLGLQLSAAAVAGLAMGYRPIPRTKTWTESLKYRAGQALRMSGWATAAIAPLIAYTFGTFSPIAILANPLIALAVSVVLPLALVAFAVELAVPALAGFLLKAIVTPLMGWVALVADVGSRVPWGNVSIPEFSPWWLVPMYALLLLAWRWHPVEP